MPPNTWHTEIGGPSAMTGDSDLGSCLAREADISNGLAGGVKQSPSDNADDLELLGSLCRSDSVRSGIVVFYTGTRLPEYVVQMPREPLPSIWVSINQRLEKLIHNAIEMNPAIHDGAILCGRSSTTLCYRIIRDGLIVYFLHQEWRISRTIEDLHSIVVVRCHSLIASTKYTSGLQDGDGISEMALPVGPIRS